MGLALSGAGMNMQAASSSQEIFFTPTELCERWKIDPRTLDKLELPWCWITPRVRRVSASIVFSFEKSQNLVE
jgi:hypothetical protein